MNSPIIPTLLHKRRERSSLRSTLEEPLKTFRAKRLKFDRLVRSSLFDTLQLLGNGAQQSVARIVHQGGVPGEDLPLNLDEIDETLDGLFGVCASILKNEVARRVSSAMNIERPRLGRSLGAMLTEMRPSYW